MPNEGKRAKPLYSHAHKREIWFATVIKSFIEKKRKMCCPLFFKCCSSYVISSPITCTSWLKQHNINSAKDLKAKRTLCVTLRKQFVENKCFFMPLEFC